MTLGVPTLQMPRRLFYGDRSFRFRATEPARSTRIIFYPAVSTITDVGAAADPSRGSARSTLSPALRFFRLYAPQRPVSTFQSDTSRSPRSSYTSQQLGENVYPLLEKHRGCFVFSAAKLASVGLRGCFKIGISTLASIFVPKGMLRNCSELQIFAIITCRYTPYGESGAIRRSNF